MNTSIHPEASSPGILHSMNKLAIHDLDGISFVGFQDILFLEAKKAYTIVHLTNGRKLVATKSLKHFAAELPENLFFRIHHNAIINLVHVERYIKADGGAVKMTNNTVLYISRRKKSDFLSWIQTS